MQRDHTNTTICCLSPGSGGLALSVADVDALPDNAEDWEELVEDISSTTKSGSYNQSARNKPKLL